MINEFKILTLKDKEIFDRFFKKYPQNTSEFTFTGLFCWRLSKNYTFTIFNNYLIIRLGDEKHHKFYQPVGPNPAQTIKKLSEIFKDSCFVRIEKNVAQVFEPNFIIRHERDMDDYVYSTKDLATFSGKKYDGKRNFLKQFEKYNAQIKSLKEIETSDIMNFQQRWCLKQDCEKDTNLITENMAMEELLYNFKTLNVFGTALIINNQIEGLAIGEELNSNTVIEHFEKANTDYKGIYQSLLNAFAKSLPEKYTFINREEDLGISGLRKSKLSYNPTQIIEKYAIRSRDVAC
ncbi:MAG: phosphatidylglycerol lysyltransferase domain-containing protein [Candidatus Gracilibacteria bacterium]|jgi:hypothetical protein